MQQCRVSSLLFEGAYNKYFRKLNSESKTETSKEKKKMMLVMMVELSPLSKISLLYYIVRSRVLGDKLGD